MWMRGTACAGVIVVLSVFGFGLSASASAAPPFFSDFCSAGSEAGQCETPRGIAVAPITSPSPGHLYIADQQNRRINEFDAWGQFIRSWGWGVDTGAAKFEICTTASTCQNPQAPAGSGTGGGAGQFGGVPQGVAVDSAGAVYVVDLANRRVEKFSAAGQFLRAFGGDVVSSGPGNTGVNEQQTVTVKATAGKISLTATTATGTGHPTVGSSVVEISATLGSFNAGDAVTGSGIPANTVITAVGSGTITLSAPATQTNISELTAKENTGATGTGTWISGSTSVTGLVTRSGEFAAGERISGTGISAGTTIESVSLAEGKLTLSAPTTAPGTNVVLTATDIPFNASAAEMRAVLEALPGIATGDVNVTGGPGDATGSAPYVITFANGLLARNDLDPMTSTTANIDGAGKAVTIVSTNGGGPEICVASSDVCKKGSEGTANGQFGALAATASFIAVGPGDKVYVGDKERIQVFNPAGQYQESIPVAAGKTVRSVAVDAAGNIYAALVGENNVLKWNSALVPQTPVAVEAPIALATDGQALYAVTGSSASLIRKFDPAGIELENWGQEEPPSPALAAPTGLAVGTACFAGQAGVYTGNNSPKFVRAYGPAPNRLVLGEPVCPPPPIAPTIVSQFATGVDADGATLNAVINPHFWPDTMYYVQYGTQACVEGGWTSPCVSSAPTPPGDLLTGAIVEADVATTPIVLSGLAPNTTYLYRFVAESGGGPSTGADATFKTFSSSVSSPACANDPFRIGLAAPLPDCRAYEMVSPVDKGNAELAVPGPAGGLTDLSVQPQLAATEGNAITYTSFTAFGNPKSAPAASQYLSRRSETGWSTENITPFDFEGYTRDPLVGFTADLSRAIVNVTNPALVPGAPEGVQNLYRRDNDDGSLELLTTNVPVLTVEKSAYEAVFSGASDGLETVAFGAEGKLTTDAPIATGAAKNLYLWSEDGGLQLLSVFPDGSPAPANAFNGIGGQAIAFGPSGQPQRNTVSDDGSTIFWTYGGVFEGKPQALFARIGGSSTVRIDEPNQGVPGTGGQGEYWMASTNGDRVFFTDVNNLTADANASGGNPDLYMYDFDLPAGERLVDLSPSVGESAAVQGVLGASNDGTYVYFVAKGKLTGEEENGNGEKALAGQFNLYGWREGEGLRFIGVLSGVEDSAAWVGALNQQSSRVSPNGRFVAFHSINRLTGYDNTDIGTGDPDSEVFLYDFQNDRLVCASCNPGGGRPAGSASLPTWGTPHQQPRYLSDSGRVFFESFDALSLSDVNEKRDVYQFELSGTGGCSPSGAGFVPISGGCVALVSTGTSSDESYFVDASQNGNDVFITTRQRLRPKEDQDERYDVYDARVGGGFDEPQPPLACEGEGCRGAVTGPGPAALAGTAKFSGPGDPAPKRCKKGFTRKGGKCVKVKSKSGKKGKKSRAKARHSSKTGRAGR